MWLWEREMFDSLPTRVSELEAKLEKILKSKADIWAEGYMEGYKGVLGHSANPSLFGGDTNTPKSLVFSENINTPCTAEVEVLKKKVEQLKSSLLRHARENNKRAEKREETKNTLADWITQLRDERAAYFLSGKAEGYAHAHKKVVEILG